MDEILKNKPVAQMEAADDSVKSYVLLLERKLRNCITMNNLNKEIERKLFVTLEELNTLKLQTEKNSKSDEQTQQETNKLKVDNTLLEMENKKLKQQIIMLNHEYQRLRSSTVMFNTSPAAVNTKTETQQSQANSNADKDPDANSILVKGLAEHQLKTILKINIIQMGRLMNLKVLDADIVKVTQMERKYYERHNMKPNKIILIVQLRTAELKIEFLKNKEKLKTSHSYQGIEIIDYVSDDVYNLYQYAKMLKNCGYAQIYWRNNCVYAKKTRSTYCDPVPIRTKADVEILKNSKK